MKTNSGLRPSIRKRQSATTSATALSPSPSKNGGTNVASSAYSPRSPSATASDGAITRTRRRSLTTRCHTKGNSALPGRRASSGRRSKRLTQTMGWPSGRMIRARESAAANLACRACASLTTWSTFDYAFDGPVEIEFADEVKAEQPSSLDGAIHRCLGRFRHQGDEDPMHPSLPEAQTPGVPRI